MDTVGSGHSDRVADGVDGPGPADPERVWSRSAIIIVAGLAALALLVAGATAGAVLARNSGSVVPGNDSVDAGFARDMIDHHRQGVLIAHLAEQGTADPEIARYAYDIAYTQTAQIGQMEGWLALWGLPELGAGPHMAWMMTGGHEHGATAPVGAPAPASAALMPGLATEAEIARLASLRGTASDVYFLQLMIRHHQGGTAMMAYAGRHAANPVVRNFAEQMLSTQRTEVTDMTAMLRQRGARPLPFTAPTVPGG